MTIGELTARLIILQAKYGDEEVLVDCGYNGQALSGIQEIDMGASDEGIIIWLQEDPAADEVSHPSSLIPHPES